MLRPVCCIHPETGLGKLLRPNYIFPARNVQLKAASRGAGFRLHRPGIIGATQGDSGKFCATGGCGHRAGLLRDWVSPGPPSASKNSEMK